MTSEAHRPVQRSFDIFDTLIARRCIWPGAVFDEVERRSGLAGVAAARRAAEASFGDREYTLADIHALLARQLGLDAAQAQALMALEIEVELENVLPVADAMSRVQSDSLLITDMYLPESVIRRLLQRAGLAGHFVMLRSAHGKRSGRVWAALVEAGMPVEHLGDNPRADVEQPRAAGLRATLTTQTQPTPTEAALLAAGLPLLACALREARLSTPRGELGGELGDDLVRLQSELNLPVLAASALHLLATAGDLPQLRLLFSSRDARYLQRVYDALAEGLPGAHPSSHYWLSSRLARTGGEPDYLAYCRELIGPAAWLVDLCGTGASVLALRERLGIPARQAQLFVCEFIDSPQQTADLMRRYGLGEYQPPAALWTDKTLVPNEVLELLNYVPEGMVRGVRAVPGGFVPLREPMEFTPDVLAAVQAQEAYVHAFARQLAAAARVPGEALLREFRERGPQACAAIGSNVAGLVPQMSRLMQAWLPGHRLAEAALRERLGAGS